MKNVLLLCFLVPCLSLGQSLTLDEFLDYRFPTGLTASTSQGMIAWVENDKGIRNLFIAQAPDYQPLQLTSYQVEDGQDINQITFTPDDRHLIYVRGQGANRKGEFPNPTSNPAGVNQSIYQISIEGGPPRKLADGTGPVVTDSEVIFLKSGQVWQVPRDSGEAVQLFKVRGTSSALRLSPNRSRLAFVNGRGDHAFIGVYHLADSTLHWLDPSMDQDSNPVWSPDGEQIAFLRTPYDPNRLFVPRRSALPFSIQVANVNSGNASTLWTADQGQGSAYRSISAANQIFWTADDQIVFPWEKDGWTHLYQIAVNDGTVNLLTPGKFEVQFASISPDRKTILFSSNQGDIDRQHVWRTTMSSNPVQLTGSDGIQWASVMDGLGNIAFLGSGATTPASVYYLKNDEPKLVRGNPSYPSKHLVPPEQVVFTAADGMKIHGQLFKPKSIGKDEKRPAVLFFHGGSRRQMLLGFHHRGYYHYAYAMNQYLAHQGYVVLSVNYRSGIGYGMEFREASNYGAGGASEFNDVLGAGLYMQNHPQVDPERIGLWGGSYGGYLTGLGLSRASDLFKAGVDIHGVLDWNKVIKGFRPSYNPLSNPEFAKLAYDSSPIASIEGWRSPVLLIHGDDDRNVPFNESVMALELLRKNGVEVEQLVFPDEVHGFLLHSNWKKAYAATADFFRRHLAK